MAKDAVDTDNLCPVVSCCTLITIGDKDCKVSNFGNSVPHVGLGQPPYPFTSPSSTLFLLFTFSFSYLLYLFSYFSIPSLSTRIGSLHFQAAT